MKSLIGLSIIALLLTVVTPIRAQDSGSAIRIGTFDSRGVAVAYGRSDAFRVKLADLKHQHRQAKDAGDTRLADSLEALGIAWQDKMHKQVFGNAPIPAIMEELKDVLPGIAQKAGVDILINIWDIPFKNDKVETVDLTDEIADHFKPTEETLRIIHRLKDTPPVPVDELSHEH